MDEQCTDLKAAALELRICRSNLENARRDLKHEAQIAEDWFQRHNAAAAELTTCIHERIGLVDDKRRDARSIEVLEAERHNALVRAEHAEGGLAESEKVSEARLDSLMGHERFEVLQGATIATRNQRVTELEAELAQTRATVAAQVVVIGNHMDADVNTLRLVVQAMVRHHQEHETEKEDYRQMAHVTSEECHAITERLGITAEAWGRSVPVVLEEMIGELRDARSRVLDHLVEQSQHRDAWRGYAYGTRDKPADYLDGNMVDRGSTLVERLQAENAAMLDKARDCIGWGEASRCGIYKGDWTPEEETEAKKQPDHLDPLRYY